jgi:hypothetical protein
MLKCLGTITQLSEKIGIPEVVECSYRDTKFTWEIIGIYRALNEGM